MSDCENKVIQVELYIQKTKSFIQIQTVESDNLISLVEAIIQEMPSLSFPKQLIFHINNIEVDGYIQLGRLKKNLGLTINKLLVHITQTKEEPEDYPELKDKSMEKQISFNQSQEKDKQAKEVDNFSDQCCLKPMKIQLSQKMNSEDQLFLAVKADQPKLIPKNQNLVRNQVIVKQYHQSRQERQQEIKFNIRIQFQDLHDIRQIQVLNCEGNTTLRTIFRNRKEEIPDFDIREFIYNVNNFSIKKQQLTNQLKSLPEEWKTKKSKNLYEIYIKVIAKYNGG